MELQNLVKYLLPLLMAFGIVVEAVYVTLFLIYAPKGMRAKTAILVGILDVGLLAVAIAVTQLAMNGDVRIDAVGFMGAALNIIMYASPLAAMKTLSFTLFLNGGIWAFYAVLVHDLFLGVPNGTGFTLGIAQLVLYAIYRNAKPTRNTTFDVLEEGCSQREHLIPSSHQFIT